MNIFKQFIFNFLEGGFVIGSLFFIIDLLRMYNPLLIPYFGFMSASFFFMQLFQYYYIKKTINKYTKPFLEHSVYGYFFLFIFSIILYFTYIYNNNKYNIILLFAILNILLWIIYFFIYKHIV